MTNVFYLPRTVFNERLPVKNHSSRVYGFDVDPLQVDPLQISFPDTVVGSTSEGTLTLTNGGTEPIEITALQLTGDFASSS
ncbi:hypothetical protein [Roseococcus sp.]|uniref:hypothetical protein n=1 Tax=Roseococcus sp. TaxID=2109646 RepID=UPI003BAA9CFC